MGSICSGEYTLSAQLLFCDAASNVSGCCGEDKVGWHDQHEQLMLASELTPHACLSTQVQHRASDVGTAVSLLASHFSNCLLNCDRHQIRGARIADLQGYSEHAAKHQEVTLSFH